MKPPFHFCLASLVCVTASALAQQDYLPEPPLPGQPALPPPTEAVKYTLLKPNDKTSELVKPEERNPFGKSESEMKSLTGKGTNEENQVRELLERLRVVGVTPGPNGMRVMLGDMILEPGQLVPPVLPQQSITLQVQTISQEAITLMWVEKNPTGLPPRTLTIPVDLRPYVRVKLMGQPTDKNRWEKTAEDATKVPVSRQFKGTPDTTPPADAVVKARPAPAAPAGTPAAAPTPAVPVAVPVDDAPPAVPTAAAAPEEKPSPEWDQAMKLLQKIMPAKP